MTGERVPDRPKALQVTAADGSSLHVICRPAAGEPRYTLLLVHGWPGSSDDWGPVLDRICDSEALRDVQVVVPELRGFGRSAAAATAEPAGPPAHLSDLGAVLAHTRAGTGTVVGGYDLGATLAQGLARSDPSVRGLLLGCPPYPGIGERRFEPQVQAELWYQHLHVQPWAGDLVAADRRTLEVYLRHFYTHWWGDGTVPEDRFQSVVDLYAAAGAFDGSIGWYRARAAGRAQDAAAVPPPPLPLPTEVLWGSRDPVNPVRFSDRLVDHFTDLTLTVLDGAGHFVPLEAPDAAAAALHRLDRRISGSENGGGKSRHALDS